MKNEYTGGIILKKLFEQYKFIIFGVGITSILLFILISSNKGSDQALENIDLVSNNAPAENHDLEEKNSKKEIKIIVDVKGEVVKPGIYEAGSDDRIQDVITRAGGFRKKADVSQVNLAQKIKDEMVIYVPKIGEKNTNNFTHTHESNNLFQGDQIKININTANSEELQKISGIGPSKAEAIIEYREQNGLFKKIEDITNVTGIGDKTFEKLKDSITIE